VLTDAKISKIKSSTKLLRIRDSMGLYLYVGVGGTKTWVHRFTLKNRKFALKIGNYPSLSLSEARRIRDKNKDQLRQGINPALRLNVNTGKEKTLNEAFYEWIEFRRNSWTLNYFSSVQRRYNLYVKDQLGELNLNLIDSKLVLNVLKKIESMDKLDTLQKIKGILLQIFKFSVGMEYVSRNPVQDIPSYIFKKKIKKNYSFFTDEIEIGKLLRRIESYKGSITTKIALKIAPHIFLRPSELVGLKWKEINFIDMNILIEKGRMKTRRSHFVPLSIEVYEDLFYLKNLKLCSEYVFPSSVINNKHISPETLRAGLRRMGYKKEQITTHGFRHIASTLLHESGFDSSAIERQLAHIDSNQIRGTYNHAQLIEYRRIMMQKWSDKLTMLKLGKNHEDF